jgi:SAM-dependent methyltransferase
VRRLLEKIRGLGRARDSIAFAEGWWFDWRRNVRTLGHVPLSALTLVGSGQSGYDHVPVRPTRARQALHDLPIADHSDYVFVDLGSGKGRALFLAAKYPFRRIEGVEFAVDLHEEATRNIARYRHRERRCGRIESLNMDAVDYRFPAENLVLHFFNPFGPAVMEKVLAHLAASIAAHPRHVVLAMLYPELAGLVEALPFVRPYRRTRAYHIYQTEPGEPPARGGDSPRPTRAPL